MKRHVLLLAGVLAISIICGCIDSTTTIAVRKDGSGLVMETVYVDKSVEAMMKEMMSGMTEAMGAEEKETKTTKEHLDIEKYKAKAAEMGKGVKFVSAKEVKKEDGSPGTQIIYSFDDIRELKVSSEPENPASESMAGMMPSTPDPEEKSAPITFDFIKGSTSKLIINLPEDADKEIKTEKPEEISKTPDMASEEMGMMKMFLGGLRVRAMVKIIDGKITKTNASYVEKIEDSQYVTLFDMNMGKLMEMEGQLEKLGGMDQIKELSEARKLLKDIPGFKIEPENRIEIDFR